MAPAVIAVGNEPQFDFDSAEYRTFFDRFGVSPFQHPDWLGPFYRLLPEAAGCSPLILVGRELGTGEVRCVVPLLKPDDGRRPEVTFAFLGVTDYACPVVDPAAIGELRLRDDLDRIVGDHAIDIAPVHRDHRAVWTALLELEPELLSFGSHALQVTAEATEVAGPRRRSQLRRKARRLSELGKLRLEIVEGDEARSAIEVARSWRSGRFPGDPLQIEPTASFYGEVAARGGGLARTYRLIVGGRPVAVLFGLIHGRRFHYMVLACDYQAYSRYSPGLLIMSRAIEVWAAEGGEVFDFTIGDEPFKADFGCSRTPMYAVRKS